MNQTVSSKNTKNEILVAYEALSREAKNLKKVSRQEQKMQIEQQETVRAASEYTPQQVHAQMAMLKQNLHDNLKTITEQIDTEYEKFAKLKQAIALQEKQLKEAYDINKEAHTLDTLLLAQKQKIEAFEEAMAQKKADFEQFKEIQKSHWEKDQTAIKLAHKEERDQQQKKWQREKEEYGYGTKRERAQDEDAYQIKKTTQEKELADKRAALETEFAQREAALNAGEKELKELRQQVEGFPGQLQKSVKEAEQQITQQLTQHHQYEKDLLLK
ncbi:MAG: hypothetical protein V3V61_07900, partial [Gammaproteobacteria bacterium]